MTNDLPKQGYMCDICGNVFTGKDTNNEKDAKNCCNGVITKILVVKR